MAEEWIEVMFHSFDRILTEFIFFREPFGLRSRKIVDKSVFFVYNKTMGCGL